MFGDASFLIACRTGRKEIVEMLLENYPNIIS